MIERYDPAYRSEVVVGGEGGSEPVEVGNMLGLFLCRGAFSGVYARCGRASVMGTWGQHLDLGCLVVNE